MVSWPHGWPRSKPLHCNFSKWLSHAQQRPENCSISCRLPTNESVIKKDSQHKYGRLFLLLCRGCRKLRFYFCRGPLSPPQTSYISCIRHNKWKSGCWQMTFSTTPIINPTHSLPSPFYLPQRNGRLSGTEKGNEAPVSVLDSPDQ